MNQFKPDRSQSLAKAKLFSALKSKPLVDLESLSDVQIGQLSGSKKIELWMAREGFREWLLNEDYDQQLIKAGASLGISEMFKILECQDLGKDSGIKASDKIKVAFEFMNRAGLLHSEGKTEAKLPDSLDEIDKKIEEELKRRSSLRVANKSQNQ